MVGYCARSSAQSYAACYSLHPDTAAIHRQMDLQPDGTAVGLPQGDRRRVAMLPLVKMIGRGIFRRGSQ
jgi:hypothetical protein